jgi:hypothetical protein
VLLLFIANFASELKPRDKVDIPVMIPNATLNVVFFYIESFHVTNAVRIKLSHWLKAISLLVWPGFKPSYGSFSKNGSFLFVLRFF